MKTSNVWLWFTAKIPNYAGLMITKDKMYKNKSGEPLFRGAGHNDKWFCRDKRTSITMG